MTRRVRRAEVKAAVERWKSRLLLDHWDIQVVMTTKIERGRQAEFYCLPEYFDGCLRIHPAKVPPEELDSVVAHELIHAHLWPMWEMLEDLTRSDPRMAKLASDAHEALASTFQRILTR